MLIREIREAISQILSNRYSTLTAMGIMSIILLVFGMFLLSFYNLDLFAETLKKNMQVIAYLDDPLSPEKLQAIKEEIEGFEEVEGITYISKDYALEMLARDTASVRGIVEELKRNPLPDSFRISLKGNARNPEGIRALVEKLKGIRGVNDIGYGEEWVERLNVLISTLKIIGWVIGGIIGLVVLFIIFNTVKFNLLTRREEIEIMKFAGATNLFIKIPFVIEGGILGLISAICSIGLLFLTYKLILYKIPPAAYVWLGGIEFTFLSYKAIFFVICTGVLLGCLGSWVSVGRYLGVAIILFLCLNINNLSFAKVKESQDIENQGIEKRIEETQKKLEDINRRIREKKMVTRKTAMEEKKVREKIGVKERDITEKKRDINKIGKELVAKEREIERVQKDIDNLASKIDEKKKEMADFLRYMYKSHTLRNSGMTELILASTDYHDFIMRSKYEGLLIDEANRIMKNLGEEVNTLETRLLFMNRRHYTLLAEKEKLTRDKAMLEKEVRADRIRLAGIQNRKAEYEAELRRLASASAALKNLIESYERQRREHASVDTGFGREKGRLIWPLSGDVVSRFGRQKHPEFDDYVFKKGIEIVSDREREVKAVFDGVVAYAEWLNGYGLIVIIDHGNSYYSIYAHASRLLVSKGTKVKRGQVIALSGNGSGNLSDKEGIYFEIRHNGQPIDPLAWLKTGSG